VSNDRPARDIDESPISLPLSQCAAIVELGNRGPGGEFDPVVMSSLLTQGFVDINSNDRRLVLTERGRLAYQILRKVGKTTPDGGG